MKKQRYEIDDTAVRDQLTRILSSSGFQKAERYKKLLRYIVEEKLAGRKNRIKAYTIAVDVLGRGEDFDQQNDTIVRVEFGRLRRRLDQFYANEGRNDQLRFRVPRGTYVPIFEVVDNSFDNAGTTTTTGSVRFRQNHLTPPLIVMLVVVGLIAISSLVWLTSSTRESVTINPPTGSKPIVAVLPLQQIGTTLAPHDLASGVVADVITDLSRISGLQIISFDSTSRLIGSTLDFKKIGSKLGVTHLVHGVIQNDDKKYRINMRLHRVGDGNQIWAERFDYDDQNIFATQGEIARKVAAALSVKLQPVELNLIGKGSLHSLKAQTLYRQVREFHNPPSDPLRYKVTTMLLRRIIELDPKSSIGYGGLAFVLAEGAWFGQSSLTVEMFNEVEKLAAKAVEIDPRESRAFVGRCIVSMLRKEYEQAIAHCKTAVDARPSDDTAWAFYGLVQNYSGKPKDGTESIKTAIRLNPLDPRTGYLNMLGQSYFHAGEYDKALMSFQGSVREGGPVGPHILTYLAACRSKLGKLNEARITLKDLKRFGSGFSMENWLRRAFHDPREVDRVMTAIANIN